MSVLRLGIKTVAYVCLCKMMIVISCFNLLDFVIFMEDFMFFECYMNI